jgi:TATA-box binding protein (TBP) (component of TFIID and TFIIIB)
MVAAGGGAARTPQRYRWWNREGAGVGKQRAQGRREEAAVNLPAHCKLTGCAQKKLHLLSLAQIFEVGNFCATNTSVQMPPWIGGTAVIKPSGNMMVVGCSTHEDVRRAIEYITERMRHLGHDTRYVEPTMTCTVCSFSVGHDIDLRKLLALFPHENVSYRPSKFPAVRIYQQDGEAGEPHFTASVFRNGGVVVNGSFTQKDSAAVKKTVTEWLRQARA